MQWKIIDGFTDYKISDTGIVYSLKRNQELKQYEKKQYLGVYLYNDNGKKFRLVHRLVANAFIPNNDNLPQINHKDENSKNNNVNNLEWCTAKYNSNYGTHKEKIRKRMLENNPFKGKHHTEETKIKLRNFKLGKKLSEETKRKISISNKGNGRPSKRVYCQELNIVYKSILEAEKKTGIQNGNIVAVCLGKRKTAGKYHWNYVKEE